MEAPADRDRGGRAAARVGAAGALLGMAGVAAGAFGAHALEHQLAPALWRAYETAARYQILHALALVVTGLALERGPSKALAWAGGLFLAGIVLFSGSLYALALGGASLWGLVTPFGGACFLAGWAALAAGLWRRGSAANGR